MEQITAERLVLREFKESDYTDFLNFFRSLKKTNLSAKRT